MSISMLDGHMKAIWSTKSVPEARLIGGESRSASQSLSTRTKFGDQQYVGSAAPTSVSQAITGTKCLLNRRSDVPVVVFVDIPIRGMQGQKPPQPRHRSPKHLPATGAGTPPRSYFKQQRLQ